MKKFLTSLLALLPLNFGCAASDLQVVEKVEIQEYMGVWYEVASFRIRPQRNCEQTTAEYTLRDDGRVTVFNRCYDTEKKEFRSITGSARVTDSDTNAKLRVRFFGPFGGKYWIIGLDEDYQWAIVGHPGRKYLWFLSRTPCMDQALFEELTRFVVEERGYDLAQLKPTRQVRKDGSACEVTLP